jgi:capsid protein
MSLVGRILSALRPAPKPDPKTRLLTLFQQRYAELKARYDAAVTNDDNRRHWAGADGLSSAAANSPGVRQTLRNRSRYEYDNSGHANGIVRTRADDLVGTGPTLQVQTDDDELAQQIEGKFAAWAKEIRLAEKLHTLDQARNRDGEAFAVLVTNEALTGPVKLDLVPIEADRIADPGGGFTTRFTPDGFPLLDGIAYDRFGNPVSYTVLRQHPGDNGFGFAQEFDIFPAKFVLHWFRRDRPGQLRGVPEMTASLPLFAYMRRWTLATLAAAETAASFAVMLETEASPDTSDGSVEGAPNPFETLEFERNMMTALPTGVKAHQFAAEHPNTQYGDFHWAVLGECARPLRMPTNVAAGDTSRSNFASAKIDHLAYRGGVRVDRAYCESHVLERVFAAWSAEAATVPDYLPADAGLLPRKWYWPGWASWDKADAKQDTEQLNNGTTTLAELLAEWGLDWRDVVRQRGKELKFCAAEGVPPPPVQGTPQTPPGSEDDTPAKPPAKAGTGRLNGFHLNGAN